MPDKKLEQALICAAQALLERENCASVLLPIPDVWPPEYVVAGTKKDIEALLKTL